MDGFAGDFFRKGQVCYIPDRAEFYVLLYREKHRDWAAFQTIGGSGHWPEACRPVGHGWAWGKQAVFAVSFFKNVLKRTLMQILLSLEASVGHSFPPTTPSGRIKADASFWLATEGGATSFWWVSVCGSSPPLGPSHVGVAESIFSAQPFFVPERVVPPGKTGGKM